MQKAQKKKYKKNKLKNSTIDNNEESATIVHGGITPDSFSIIGTKVRLGNFDSARLVTKPNNSTGQEDMHGLGLAIYNIVTERHAPRSHPKIDNSRSGLKSVEHTIVSAANPLPHCR